MPNRSISSSSSASRRRRLGVTCALVVLSLLAAPARFAARAEEDPEALIRKGLDLRRSGEEAKAHGYLQRAYELARTPRSVAQLGLSWLALGNQLQADILLSEAVRSSDPWVTEHKADLEKALGAARSKLGRVFIDGAPADSTVTVTGRPPAKLTAGEPIWIKPGAVHVRIECPGRSPYEDDVRVPTAGGTTRLLVSLRPANSGTERVAGAGAGPGAGAATTFVPTQQQPDLQWSGAGSSSPGTTDAGGRGESNRAEQGRPGAGTDSPAQAGGGWRRPVFWSALGLGVAMVVFGVYETTQYFDANNDFNDPRHIPLCRDGGGTVTGNAVCPGLKANADSAQTLSIVGYAAAGALAVTALIVILTEPSAAPAAPKEAMARCAPWLGAAAGGGSCVLRF